MDSGIRHSEDVAKALLLGASLVGLGRHALYPCILNGAAGVYASITDLARNLVMLPKEMDVPTLQEVIGLALKRDDGTYKTEEEFLCNPNSRSANVYFDYLHSKHDCAPGTPTSCPDGCVPEGRRSRKLLFASVPTGSNPCPPGCVAA